MWKRRQMEKANLGLIRQQITYAKVVCTYPQYSKIQIAQQLITFKKFGCFRFHKKKGLTLSPNQATFYTQSLIVLLNKKALTKNYVVENLVSYFERGTAGPCRLHCTEKQPR